MADYQTDSLTGSQAQPQGRAAVNFKDQLSEEYTIDTPENVSFGYEVAGIGSRFIATLIDELIIAILLIGLNIAVIVAVTALAGDSVFDPNFVQENENWVVGIVLAIYALLNFLIWWGYYTLFEWLWHGQTIGKRTARIRVVRWDGAPIGFIPLAVRNLVRIVDFLPASYAIGVVTMFCNRQSRRLGDFAAGTLVVKDQGEVTLDSLMSAIPKRAPTPLRTEVPVELAPTGTPELSPDQDWSAIRRLTSADYELVQETLARYRNSQLDTSLLRRVALAIATKLERTSSSQLESVDQQVAFLKDVATAYGRWVK